ncbi:hypothetical protein [Sorangium sp. So ce381]|uniref:hypothetical protein n=1 Tax=Sorangium sp. So ce381 TaxID=3133307 RepID=UPI003F5B4874
MRSPDGTGGLNRQTPIARLTAAGRWVRGTRGAAAEIKEAVAAIAETRNARKAIAEDKRDDAVAALERATGKVSILLARTQSERR